MDATTAAGYWRPFWARRDARPALLLVLIMMIWARVQGHEVYWQWRAQRLVDAALRETLPLQQHWEAVWLRTGACPQLDVTADFAASKVIDRAYVGDWYQRQCGLQLNLKAKPQSRLAGTRLMLVYDDAGWRCLSLSSSTAASVDACTDSIRRFSVLK